MCSVKYFAAAAAVVFAIGCGNGVDRVPEEEGGGLDGFGGEERTTPAERTSGPGAGTELSAQDRQFVNQVSEGNQMEIALGRMAEDKAQSDEVKQLGEQIASDHATAERELQASLGSGDVTTAQRQPATQMTELSGEAEQIHNRLEGLSGAQFDQAYLEQMVKHHQENIQKFEQQAQQTDNAEVRSFIEETLPTLREHLEQSQQLQQRRQTNR